MGDTNVKIKLSADGAQVRRELKLIDREIQQLGGSQSTSQTRNQSSSQPNSETQSSTQLPAIQRDSREVAKQESRDKTNERLSRELTIIRKELQKLNGNNGSNGGGGGSYTPPPSSGGTGGGDTNIPPQGGSGTGGSGTGGSKLGDVLGKLATAAVALKAASAAFSYIRQGAAESRAGESLAYQTYGSTLMYTDYYKAKKDSYEIGLPYGYDYQTVMSAGDANMAKAGFTTVDNYTNDMNAILRTSKGWGIDTNTLGSASGYMTSIGAVESGSQDKFTKMLSQSIVDAKMTGREDEQLQVLEEIAESLASVNTTVSENAIGNQLNMYNALVAQNENLKGTRGSTLVNDISGLAKSKDTSLDILAGFGTKYTGIEGKLQLWELAENDPTKYMQQAVQGAREMGMDDAQIMYKFVNAGFSVSQARDALNGIESVDKFDYSDTTAGEKALDERIDNYNGSDVSTNEKYEINKQYAKEATGDTLWNTIANPFKQLFSGLPTWAQGALGVAGSVAPTIMGGIGINKAWNWAKGKFTGAGSGTGGGFGFGGSGAGAGATDDILRGAANSTDEVIDLVEGADGVWRMPSAVDDGLKAAGNSVDEVLGAVGDGSTALATLDDAGRGLGGVDDALRAAGGLDDAARVAGSLDDVAHAASGLSKAGKALGVAGMVIEGGVSVYDAYKAHERDDDREMAQEIGGGVGGIAGGAAGGWGGAAAGAAIGTAIFPGVGTAIGGLIGGLIGGIGGGMAGNALGEAAGEGIYDVASGGDKYNFSNAEKEQIKKYYDEVSRLYEEEGNNAAQDYTKKYVAPYLNSLGVSTSITDEYNWDVGRPDFMKDIEDERFGSLNYHDEEVERTRAASDGVDNLTDEQKKQIQAYYDEVSRLYEEEGNDAAQDYTKETITPYLRELGYSKSFTDKYNWDVGKPDFLKDVEKGNFGDLSSVDDKVAAASDGVDNLTDEQKKQIQAYYDEVSRLYEEEGNDAAQDYTKETITPYLRELGYSKSFTDKYNWDVGKPDFLKDVEKGNFGDLSSVDDKVAAASDGATAALINGASVAAGVAKDSETGLDLPDTFEVTSENTTALEENTEALIKVAESLGIDATTSDATAKSGEATNDRTTAMSNSKTQGSQTSWWSRLFGKSHATGNDYVPYDNYLASLHKGEMVLTEAEATDYRQGKVSAAGGSGQISGSLDININLNGGMAGMSPNAEKQIVEAVKAQLSTNRMQEMLSNGFKRMQNC